MWAVSWSPGSPGPVWTYERSARERLMAAWGDAAFVEQALATWRSFVDAPERATDTVWRLLGRPALTFRQWAEDHAADFR
ncbi:hypothetical protein [Nonomuraea sp. NPDC049309]|uniref:hypothetical protein n=1 Tax=Nonomuraea sp. NPDC049309 TaxID=3364350 RepID=UPI00371109DD